MKGYCNLDCTKPRQKTELKLFNGEETLLLCPDCYDKLNNIGVEKKWEKWQGIIFSDNENDSEEKKDKLTKQSVTEYRIYHLLKDTPKLTAREINAKVGLSLDRIRNILKEMEDNEVLIKSGKGVSTASFVYEINPEAEPPETAEKYINSEGLKEQIIRLISNNPGIAIKDLGKQINSDKAHIRKIINSLPFIYSESVSKKGTSVSGREHFIYFMRKDKQA